MVQGTDTKESGVKGDGMLLPKPREIGVDKMEPYIYTGSEQTEVSSLYIVQVYSVHDTCFVFL